MTNPKDTRDEHIVDARDDDEEVQSARVQQGRVALRRGEWNEPDVTVAIAQRILDLSHIA